MLKILIINGPNLNMLGLREPGIYGNKSLEDIKNECLGEAQSMGMEIDFIQSNIEGELITTIQQSLGKYDGIIINPAAYSHTSIGILDALKSVNIPTVEVHLSNIYKRDEFRHKSYVSLYATGVIGGFGSYGYILALKAIYAELSKK